MKRVRRLFTFALALVMTFAVSAIAFAADLGEVASGTAKSITITTPATAQNDDEFTYTVYKVFDATSEGLSDNQNISYTAAAGTTITATDGLSQFKADNQGNVRYYKRTSTDADFVENKTDTALSEGMIEAIANYNGKTNVGTVTITGKGQSKTVNVGSYGYFYITTTSGTIVTIDSTNPSADVLDKNTLPTMDKDIANVTSANGGSHGTGADNENNESATANVGDTVNYTVTINAKKGAEGYVYHDILSAGLTLDTTQQPVVKAGETILAKDTDYTLTKFNNNQPNGGNNDNITITFEQTYLDTIDEDTTITITYSAIVNESAVIARTGNKNTGTLDYGRTGSTNTTPKDEPVVYSYQFQLVKDNDSKEILSGAEFELYADENCTNKIVVVADGNNYRVATAAEKATTGFKAATITAGKPEIIGLGNGTYYLKETKAPEGYNLLADAVPVTISNSNNDATITADKYSDGGVEVVNEAGTVLPSTGGIGTTIFYVVGGVMVAGAVVFLLTKRRMAGNE